MELAAASSPGRPVRAASGWLGSALPPPSPVQLRPGVGGRGPDLALPLPAPHHASNAKASGLCLLSLSLPVSR